MGRVGSTLPILTALKRLHAARKGVAAVEFALLVPFLLIAYLGAVDISQGLAADRKLSNAVAAVSDLVSRHKDSVSIDDVNAYFAAAEAIMRPFEADKTQLQLTIVHVGNSGSTEIIDSWPGAPAPDGSFELPDKMADLARGRFVVVAEGWYPYRPVTGYVVDSNIGLYKRSMHMLRYDTEDFRIAGNSGGSNPTQPGEGDPSSPGAPGSGGSGGGGADDPGEGDDSGNDDSGDGGGGGNDRPRRCFWIWCW